MSQNLRETTEEPVRNRMILRENTGSAASSSLTQELDHYLHRLSVVQNAAQLIRVFSHFSDTIGGYVQMRPEYQYIPMLIGSDNEAVPLYHFVEVMDEIVDYDLVRQELPTLSYAQIGGAISFLRKVSQINPQGADLDILEDMKLSEDPAFLDELREALADEETSRVSATKSK